MVCCGCTWVRTRLHFLGFLSWLSLALSVYSIYDCRFVDVSTLDEGNSYLLGIFALSYRQDRCVAYDDIPGQDVDVGGTAKTAQAFGVLAVTFGAIVVLMLIIMQCWVLKPRAWKVMICFAFFTAISQSLTFLLFKAAEDEWCFHPNVECNLGIDGIISVWATGLWFWLGLMALVFRAPEASSYRCVLLKKFLSKLVDVTGIRPKRDIKRSVVSISWVQGLILILALSCAIFSGMVGFGCRYFVTSFEEHEWEYGLNGYLYTPKNECRFYERGDRVSFTAATKAAQAFGFISFFTGLTLLFLLLALIIFNFPTLLRRSLPIIAFFAAVFQSFTLFSFIEYKDLVCNREDQTCGVGTDFILTLVALGLYLVVAAGIVWFAGAIANQEEDDVGMSKDPSHGKVEEEAAMGEAAEEADWEEEEDGAMPEDGDNVNGDDGSDVE